MSSASPLPADLASALRDGLLDAPETVRADPPLPLPAEGIDAAVLVPLFARDGELHIVLTRRNAGLRRHGGEVSFPGGRQDDEETDLRLTALREAHEEIGLAADAVEFVGALTPTPTVATNYVVHPFVGLIAPGLQWTLSAREVDEVIEPTVGELRERYGRRSLVRRGMRLRTDVYALEGAHIWGATARILRDLLTRLEAVGI
jgi:8-oxo-dGTP pyrophosphatase MutT (NUDIX family)